MAWRAADSLAVRTFVGRDPDTAAPDHSTTSRTRRLIDVETRPGAQRSLPTAAELEEILAG